ncbi:MAG TPA: hypothetical protein VN914_05260 [Polyangia bacterium]|nr:hypothetical protein [Polyangia bacterium]
MRRATLLLLLTAGACATSEADPGQPQPGTKPPQPQGYTRFETQPTPLVPGASVLRVEWVAPAMTEDMDVLDIRGWQSKAGHHALLYAIVEEQPVGTVRNWKNEDQLSSSLIGGSGGEAGGQLKLPPGVVMRLRKGRALVVQLHYLNTSREMVMGQSVIDVKLAPASPARRVASAFASTSTQVALPPGPSKMDIDCKLDTDVSFLMVSNHQHHLGTSSYTEQLRPDGNRQDIKRDDRWEEEWAFNPNFSRFEVNAPLVIKAGTTLHTHCEWMNGAGEQVKFPDEMCVFFGFFLGEQDLYCVDGVRQ